MNAASIRAIATRLMDAQDLATSLQPIAAATPGFDVDAAYQVLREIESRRIAQGWRPIGRKIGFTNRTIWPRYGVYQPMGVRVWAIDAANRDTIVDLLPVFRATLRKGDIVVDTGVGANVLDSPALAVAHLANVLAQHPEHPPLGAGEIVTTGTITDAWPLAPGEVWSSDYGKLPVRGITLEVA